MEQNAPTYDYPPSTSHDNMTYPNGTTGQTNFEMWGAGYQQPYAVRYPVDWMSNYDGNYQLSGQDYLTSLHSYPDATMPTSQPQTLTPEFQTTGELPSDQHHQSQTYSTAAGSPPGLQAPDSYLTLDSGSAPRPQSAGTMVESGSSNESGISSNTSSPRSRKAKVPSIQTQFDNKGHDSILNDIAVSDGIQVADSDSMTAMSNEWMHMHDSNCNDQHCLDDQSLSATGIKASPALLEPFQWQSQPTTGRRPSIGSIASGPVFSNFGTPVSNVWQQSVYNSPYSPSNNWTPMSHPGRIAGSPQSPHPVRNYATWNGSQYGKGSRVPRQQRPSVLTPSTRRPVMGRHVSDNLANPPSMLPSQPRARPAESRARNLNRGDETPQSGSAVTPQLPLPPFQLNSLFNTPTVSQADFPVSTEITTPTRPLLPSSIHTPMGPPYTTPRSHMTPGIGSMHLNTPPYPRPHPFALLPTNVPSTPTGSNPVPTPAHQPPLPIASEPPASDFLVNSVGSTGPSSGQNHSHPPPSGPIRQSPHFEGDIYTPRFKRRNAAGKWEGWCGYCQPGRWLDLKNSRYWEDKLRNHGICARTKTFFEGPVRVRWVSDRGTIWEGEAGDSGFDLAGREGLDDDGIGRKREGLCGECNQWVGMDGMRSRGRGRCVAWWMHAYKCHEQSRSRTDGSGNG